MDITRQDLEERFRQLSDEDLARRYASGDLTELATTVAHAELLARGIAPEPHQVAVEAAPVPEGPPGDLLPLVRLQTPTEAHMLQSLLESEGIPSFVSDAHTTQAMDLLAIAIGYSRVLVSAAHLPRAQEILAAYRRNEYALPEDHDKPEGA